MQTILPANLELITVTDCTIASGESHGTRQTGESIQKLEAAFEGAVHITHKNKGRLNMITTHWITCHR